MTAERSHLADLTGHPLEGVKVLDLGQIYNGPYAGFLLAMAGADVIKVEPINGEAIRDRSGRGGVSFAFGMLNSNKRDIAIDLKTANGRALLVELAKEADILLENFAPGALDRLGVGAAVLQAASPLRFHGEERVALIPSPNLGQHSREVLADWLDYDEARVDDLIKSGAVGEQAV